MTVYIGVRGCGFTLALFVVVLLCGTSSHLVPFIVPHRFVGPSSLAPHCCSGLCFGRRLSIARAFTYLFIVLKLGESWMFLMLELLLGFW